MKKSFVKIMVAGAMLLAGALAANAQPGGGPGGPGGPMDPEKMAQMRADEMKEAVKLTDEQYTKVLNLFKEESAAMEKRMQQGGGQPGGGREEMEKMMNERNEKLKAILTEEQYKTWSESEQNRRGGPGGPGGPGMGGPGGPGPRQ